MLCVCVSEFIMKMRQFVSHLVVALLVSQSVRGIKWETHKSTVSRFLCVKRSGTRKLPGDFQSGSVKMKRPQSWLHSTLTSVPSTSNPLHPVPLLLYSSLFMQEACEYYEMCRRHVTTDASSRQAACVVSINVIRGDLGRELESVLLTSWQKSLNKTRISNPERRKQLVVIRVSWRAVGLQLLPSLCIQWIELA